MEKRELAKKLIEIEDKIGEFTAQLMEVGVCIEQSVLMDVDIVRLIAEIYGLTEEVQLETVFEIANYPDAAGAELFLDQIEELARYCKDRGTAAEESGRGDITAPA